MNLDNRNNQQEQEYKDKRYDEGMESLSLYTDQQIWDMELECIELGLLAGLTPTTELCKHELANLYANGEIDL